MNIINLVQLSEALQKLNVPDNQLIEQINQYIQSIQSNPEYVSSLFRLIMDQSQSAVVQNGAALLILRKLQDSKNDQNQMDLGFIS
jgi:hypothetical protein